MRRGGAARNDEDAEPDYTGLINEIEDLDDMTENPDSERLNLQFGASEEHASSATVAPSAQPQPRASHTSSSVAQDPISTSSSSSVIPSNIRSTPSLASVLQTQKYPPSIVAAVEKAEATGSPIVLDPLDEFPPTRLKPSRTETDRATRVELWKNMRWMRKNEEYMETVRKELPFEYVLGPLPYESDDEDDAEDDDENNGAAGAGDGVDNNMVDLGVQAPAGPNESDPPARTTPEAVGARNADAPNVSPPNTDGADPCPQPVTPTLQPFARPIRPSRSTALTAPISSALCPTVPADHPCLVNPHPVYSFHQCEAGHDKEFYESIFTYLRHTGHGVLWGALVSRFFIYEESCGFEVCTSTVCRSCH